ncbi:MAG TPA: EAL domain-containing protein [Noviherbaspirillum sp.]|uniref:putative bifunctional diguanylate cyclase/phosphodiesterase n=1 Tax=Noviherbaspirillum sp. TaxID=1926288 RepID=UPI002D28F6B6|nr:EAL domain-containing protein [Noviherbaspirillum sp.]HYD94602.1 EAL domain-containing protein [Noviherbaspirillum sp.]
MSHNLQKTRTHADGIFAALFAALTPMVAGLAYYSTSGRIGAAVCSAGGGAPTVIGGGWLLALLAAGLTTLGSAWVWKHRPGRRIGEIYNAVASMVFAALVMHYGGGHGEAHFPFFIFVSFLLYYRSWRPIALACAAILVHHLAFFMLQRAGAPVVVFACIDGATLLSHIAAGLGQCVLLGYIASRMERSDIELVRSLAAQELAASVFHNTIEGVIITDDQGRIESVNPAFTQITGFSAEEAIGQTPRMLKSNHHDEAFYKDIWKSIAENGSWKGEIWNRRKSGEVFLESQTIQCVHSDDGHVRYVAVFNDITEQWRKDQRIEHLAFHDSLTGAANRALLGERLRQAVGAAAESEGTLAVMMVDLDRFKNVNDSFGHDQGDELLRAVATRLQEIVRGTDTVARLGGDEFVLLLRHPGAPEEIAAIAARVIDTIGAPIELAGLSLRVGASVGIAIYPADGADAASLLKSADTAMYDAKANGKGVFRFFSAALTDRAQARLHLEMDLRRALEHGEFELHYQPKLCLQFGTPHGAEVLVRWRHPERGLVAPAEFIPLAEETGLIEPLGDWVLEQACRQLGAWRAAGDGLTVLAVNVSAVQLHKGTLAQTVAELLARYQLPGEALEIELTESTVMSNPEQAITSMHAIRALGVKIAIDDFGTGHSSLAYLKRLPIDTLKIDRSFVVEADRNEEGAVICSSILGLARNLKLAVVAEGIENAGQLAFLKKRGCTAGQGYHFSPPLPLHELNAWLRVHEVRHCRNCAHRAACASTAAPEILEVSL